MLIIFGIAYSIACKFLITPCAKVPKFNSTLSRLCFVMASTASWIIARSNYLNWFLKFTTFAFPASACSIALSSCPSRILSSFSYFLKDILCSSNNSLSPSNLFLFGLDLSSSLSIFSSCFSFWLSILSIFLSSVFFYLFHFWTALAPKWILARSIMVSSSESSSFACLLTFPGTI